LCEKFCGDGFPNWAFTKENFPSPFPWDIFFLKEGIPWHDHCKAYPFESYFYSSDVIRSWKELFSNKDGILD
jgi:hypothetical protein